jgi:hypothetical protein
MMKTITARMRRRKRREWTRRKRMLQRWPPSCESWYCGAPLLTIWHGRTLG